MTKRNLKIRPFRFEVAWLTQDLFPNFIRNQWSKYDKNQPWEGKLDMLQNDLRVWNHDVFGCIFKKKKCLLNRLEELDFQRNLKGSNIVENEYAATWREYVNVLAQEKLLWFQKSRAKWI